MALEEERQQLDLLKRDHMSKTSQLIVERKLMNKLEEIFRAFDADQNGYISAEEICLDNVNADILEIYTPVLLEMEANQVQLDREEFIESSLALYQVSNQKTLNRSDRLLN